MTRFAHAAVPTLFAILVMAAPALAHPGHEHEADRSLAEQLAHPAFGWEHYLAAAAAAAGLIGWAAWRRAAKAGR